MWLSLTALLYDRSSAPCVALAEALATGSQDRLTSLLQAHWSGHTRLALACRTLFVWAHGYLLLAETVIAQPFATAMEGVAWVFSSQARRPVEGFSLVLLVGTKGRGRLPLGVRLWHKGGPSQDERAVAWLSSARHRLRGRPASSLFAAW